MRFASVCSGIEAASIAWHPLGWETAWLSEIEPFPCGVLAHHYPETTNLGDMTTIADRIEAGEVEAPDVFTGGTPCQAFSVAGSRGGLDDARGQLSVEFCRIANAIDDVRVCRGSKPSIIIWENVPGVLSDKTNAFGCFLAGLAGECEELQPPREGWSNAGCVFGPRRTVAWRVLDAQYFGLAQRRRRVWVVASARDDLDPVAVLFEREGVRRDSAPSREAGQGFAPDVAPSLTASGRGVARTGETRGQDPVVAVHHPEIPEVCGTLSDGAHNGGGLNGQDAYTGRILPVVAVGGDIANSLAVAAGTQVRRLTPVECERLQGFPDDYTRTPWKKKTAEECPDGPRYKALGNSWPVPVPRWIAERIEKELTKCH